jgi:hypothetical protein
MFRGVGAFPLGIFLWADRDAQFAGHAENVGDASADWRMPKNISSEFGGLALEDLEL